MARYPITLELRDSVEASAVAIGLVGVVHDESNRDRWREAASMVAERLQLLRDSADEQEQ